jgi:Undecaprenyl-phosphate glucose phosphotransferase
MAIFQPLDAPDGHRRAASRTKVLLGSSGLVQQHIGVNLRPWSRAWPLHEILPVAVAAIDFCLLLIAAAAVFTVYFDVVTNLGSEPPPYFLTALFAATLFVGGFERLGGYRLTQLSKLHWQLTRAVMAWGGVVSVLILVGFFGKISQNYSRGWALGLIIAGGAALLLDRGILHLMVAAWVRAGYLARNIVIVGAGDEGQRVIAKLQNAPDKTIAIRGIFDDRQSGLPRSIRGVTVLGTTDDLLQFVPRAPIDEVIIAWPLAAERSLKALCEKLKVLAVDLRLSVEPLAETLEVRGISYVGNVPTLDVADRPIKHWRAAIKWIEDKLLATLLLIILAPLMGIIALFIKLDSRGPVFFVQERFGFNNEVIRVFKFRTMYVDRGDPSGGQRTMRNDPRVTRLGRLLRGLSFDELPQLINVWRGDMSLVGPRPHAIAMKAGDRLYCDAVEQYLHRHRVKPGITGWAQVNGLRGEVDTLEKARARVTHDLYYIEHWSPWFDLKVLLQTVGILAKRSNAY